VDGGGLLGTDMRNGGTDAGQSGEQELRFESGADVRREEWQRDDAGNGRRKRWKNHWRRRERDFDYYA